MYKTFQSPGPLRRIRNFVQKSAVEPRQSTFSKVYPVLCAMLEYSSFLATSPKVAPKRYYYGAPA